MNNLHKVRNIFISDGTALPANNSAITACTTGKIGIYGSDWTALDPAGNDNITTQPSIFIVESKTDSNGVSYTKKSTKINGSSVITYKGSSYKPSQREVWSIGYNRKSASGSIEVAPDVDYNFIIRFKNDKGLYSERPEAPSFHFQSSPTATQLSIATQTANTINNSSFKSQITAIVVGNGTGVYGVTGATDYGVEIWSKDVNQFQNTTYTPNKVYFSTHVNDASGFGTSTTCTQIQAFSYGNGTYDEVYTIENFEFGTEGVVNRRLWPIPVLDYSSTSNFILSAAIVPTVTGTSGEDRVTFSASVAAILREGEKVELGGVNYEIKYFVSSTVAVLTSVLTSALSTAAVKVRYKYDLVVIEYNDSINTPTGVSVISNKSVILAFPAINTNGAYTTLSSTGTDVKAILDAWMTSTPRAFANISI
jgi:ribosome-associated protein YbcJ (S4-like RNA binding protein)